MAINDRIADDSYSNDKESGYERSLKAAEKVLAEYHHARQPPKNAESYRKREITINNDIYSLAYASFLDPSSEKQNDPKFKEIDIN